MIESTKTYFYYSSVLTFLNGIGGITGILCYFCFQLFRTVRSSVNVYLLESDLDAFPWLCDIKPLDLNNNKCFWIFFCRSMKLAPINRPHEVSTLGVISDCLPVDRSMLLYCSLVYWNVEYPSMKVKLTKNFTVYVYTIQSILNMQSFQQRKVLVIYIFTPFGIWS